MEVLHGSMVIFTFAGALLVICMSALILYFLFRPGWPTLLGAASTYGLWMYVDQFFGIVCGIIFLGIQLWWLHHIKEEDPIKVYLEEKKNPKKTHDLYIPGYFD